MSVNWYFHREKVDVAGTNGQVLVIYRAEQARLPPMPWPSVTNQVG
jgi:hypothetical protein